MAASALSEAALADSALPGLGGHCLTFDLGEDHYAMDIRHVREIIQMGPMTPVPLMPTLLRGVINLRGAVVPVIDLQARFGRGAAVVGKKSCVVICQAPAAADSAERVDVGLMVDAVSAVIDMADSAIEPPPAFGLPVSRDVVRGTIRRGGRFLMVIDVEAALDVDALAALCGAGAGDLDD